MGRQDDHSQDQSRTNHRVGEDANRSEDRNPGRQPPTRGQRKSPYGQRAAERIRFTRRINNRYDVKAYGRHETQESQSQTHGHRKRKKKRKESEPCIDVGGFEDEHPQVIPDEETADTKKWMTDTMRELIERKIR